MVRSDGENRHPHMLQYCQELSSLGPKTSDTVTMGIIAELTLFPYIR